MITRFDCTDLLEIYFDSEAKTPFKQIFKDHFEKWGFTYDKDDQAMYKYYHRRIDLLIGDLINFNNVNMMEVRSRWYYPDENLMEYILEVL